eukprot:TRINITY_DN7178_c0_g1_i1.p1 TRINITY_DN7178_c0_g1~~TRINITY_DN7178_c0_g1_i1.p1  ORF type:complete len:397 (+),score=88.38 TRINITY_DN7178_c0_g1_i1:80-1192(+)
MANVPSKKHFSDIKHLPSYNNRLPILAELLTTLCAKNDKSGTQSRIPVFSAMKPALVSVKDYLVRMCKYGHCSPTVFICMAVYVDRLCDKTGVELNSLNIHRILIGAFLISAKLHDDVYYSNKYYASIGGLGLKETNQIEASFLEQTDWDMYVSEEEYKMYMNDLKVAYPGGVQDVNKSPALAVLEKENEVKESCGSGHVAGTPVNALRYRRGSNRTGIKEPAEEKEKEKEKDECMTPTTGGNNGSMPLIVGPALRPPTKPVIKPSGRRPSALSNLPPEEDPLASPGRRTSTDSNDSKATTSSAESSGNGGSERHTPLAVGGTLNQVAAFHQQQHLTASGSPVRSIPPVKHYPALASLANPILAKSCTRS